MTQKPKESLGINDPKAQRITRKVDEMIAIDCHLLSVAEDVGFI